MRSAAHSLCRRELRRRGGAARLRDRLPGPVAVAALVLAGTACAPPAPRGILLVVVDTLRADHLGVYGYERETSPELDRWAERGVVFDNALASSPWTLPTFGSILTGELPSSHAAGRQPGGARWNSATGLDASVPTVTERLRTAGYATGAVVNNAFLRPRFGVDRGFASYDYQRGRRAEEVVDLALAWLGERAAEEPFFLLVHLLDPHQPYAAPTPFAGRFTADATAPEPRKNVKQIRRSVAELTAAERAYLIGAYDEEIAYTDGAIGRLFRTMEERGLWGSSLVILTADHGEELFEHGSYEHGHSLFQELLRVPLIVWGPGIEPGRETAPVSLTDLAPTMLAAAGLDPGEASDGVSLWRRLRTGKRPPARSMLAESLLYGREKKALFEWPFKLIWEPESDLYLLYDLDADPGETRELSAGRAALVTRLAERLRELVARATREGAGTAVELDEEVEEELRALGYIE